APVGAVVAHAYGRLRFLEAGPRNMAEVKRSLAGIVSSGKRAGEIVGRIRALVKKLPPRKDRVDINEAILEVISLTRNEMVRSEVSLRVDLADGLPPVDGDRIQLQQVVLNVILNALQAMAT